MIDQLVLFGANGDLRACFLRRLAALPGSLPNGFQLIAAGRHEWSGADFLRWAAEQLSCHGRTVPRDAYDAVLASARYSRA